VAARCRRQRSCGQDYLPYERLLVGAWQERRVLETCDLHKSFGDLGVLAGTREFRNRVL